MDTSQLEDDGETLLTDLHIHRGSLMNGLFYGVEDVIPPDAVLTAEIAVLGTMRKPKAREPE